MMRDMAPTNNENLTSEEGDQANQYSHIGSAFNSTSLSLRSNASGGIDPCYPAMSRVSPECMWTGSCEGGTPKNHVEKRTPMCHLPKEVEEDLKAFLDISHSENGSSKVAELLNIKPLTSLHWERMKAFNSECVADLLLKELNGSADSDITVERFMAAVKEAGNEAAHQLLVKSYEETVESHNESTRRSIETVTNAALLQLRNVKMEVQDGVVRRYSKKSSSSHSSSTTPEHPRCKQRTSCPATSSEITEILKNVNFDCTTQASSKTSQCTHTDSKNDRSRACSCKSGCLDNAPTSRRGDSRGNGEGSGVREGGVVCRKCVGMGSGKLHSVSAGSDIQRAPFTQGGRQIHVLLTYTCERASQMDHVSNLYDCLKKNAFSVSHEESDSHNLARDKLGWLDGQFYRATHILVLVTPEYCRDVANRMYASLLEQRSGQTTDQSQSSTQSSGLKANQPEGSAVLVDPSDRCLNARYIYRLMQMEYFHNNCFNKRFIPVVMPSAVKHSAKYNKSGRELVPEWLQHTLVYTWPKDYKDLLYYMMKPDRVMRKYLSASADSKQQQQIVITHQ